MTMDDTTQSGYYPFLKYSEGLKLSRDVDPKLNLPVNITHFKDSTDIKRWLVSPGTGGVFIDIPKLN